MAVSLATQQLNPAAIAALVERQNEPAWLYDWRLAAWRTFERLPFPTIEDPAWRRTDISDLDLASLRPASPPAGRPTAAIRSFLGPRGAGYVLQWNGTVVRAGSRAAAQTPGLIFCDLAQAARAHGAQLREHLGRVVSAEDASKFSALNGALHQGGLFLLVPAGVRVEAPFHFYSWTSEAGTAVLPRLVVVLEEGASARLIEEYAGPAQPDYTLCAPVTEIYLAAGAVLEHTVLQNQGANVFHIALQRAWLGRGARFHTLQVALGAEVGRTDLQVILAEPGARADLLGLSLGEKRQHLDFHTQQRHLAPHTESDLLFKAALRDRARSVFEGWIVIDRAAQQAVAYQANRNLLLSPRAKADSLPVLEIEANDVRCTHGAAVGPIDENQKYYLMSRGLDAATAEQLITLGFFADVVERSPFQEASARALAAIARKFPLEGA